MPAETAVSIVKTGSIISFGAASASVAIPTESAGGAPKYIRVVATAPCYVKIGNSGVTAAAGDVLVQPADAVVMKTLRQTHIAAIQVSGAGIVQISPMEGQ